MDERITTVLAHFFTAEQIENCTVHSLGTGRINDTYLVQTLSTSVVLQRINSSVFSEPDIVAENFFHVSKHLIRCHVSGSNVQWAKSITTLNGDPWFHDPFGDIWRVQSYIPASRIQPVELSLLQVTQLGATLALFHLLLSSLDHRLLKNPLPGFHHLPTYESEYKKVASQIDEKDDDELYCRAIIESLRDDAFILPLAIEGKVLVEHVIHGDPKIDNFIFGETGDVIGLIDLDTVYLNVLQVDIGDCLRSLCNLGGEEDRGGVFDLQLCGAFLKGYVQESGQLLSATERHYIYDALLSITYELGMRFFTDHLAGDIYFKVQRRGDNLNRAVSQFLLAEDIVRKENGIRPLSV